MATRPKTKPEPKPETKPEPKAPPLPTQYAVHSVLAAVAEHDEAVEDWLNGKHAEGFRLVNVFPSQGNSCRTVLIVEKIFDNDKTDLDDEEATPAAWEGSRS